MQRDPINTALATISQEAAAVERLADTVRSDDFRRLIARIGESSGRVVFTGIGKSAIVAQKIVATLNSTGTPALFMHAADAVHGDLGLIRPEDIVCCISKSGETPEMRLLFSILRPMGNLLVSVTANRDSFMALQSDLVLLTPIEREADPNNLAPTASSTAQMALGDALAMALQAQNGFSAEDFARYHPGGALGKKLYLRVSDLCVRHDRPAVLPEDRLPEIIVEISGKRVGATAVVDESGGLMGIITDGDLRRMLYRGDVLDGVTAREIMSPSPKTIDAHALAADALSLMRSHSITQLPVLNEGTYVGIVHLHDILQEGLL